MRWSSAGRAFICMAGEYTLPVSMGVPSADSHRRLRSLTLGLQRLARTGGGGGGWPLPAAAATPPPPPVTAKAYVVMDAAAPASCSPSTNDNAAPAHGLHHQDHDRICSCSSTCTTSPRWWRRGATRWAVDQDEIYLQGGDKLTVNQLLEALLIQSANDAAADLADAVAGSQARFVALMNAKARELGLTNTHYANPHGLDAPGHYTSALDLTHLARIAMRDPRFAGYVRHYTATIPWAHHPYPAGARQSHELLEDYPWAYGVKTGWTDGAGCCIVAAGLWRGHRILVTLLGEPDDAHRRPTRSNSSTGRRASTSAQTLWPAGAVLARVAGALHDATLALVAAAHGRRLAAHRGAVTSRVVAPRGRTAGRARARRWARLTLRRRPARWASCGWSPLRRPPGWGCREVGYRIHRAWHWLTSHL